MENIQTHILATLRQMEKHFQYQTAPCNGPYQQPPFSQHPTPSFTQYYEPPARHSSFQQDPVDSSDFSFTDTSNFQTSSEPCPQPVAAVFSYPAPSYQSSPQQLFQQNVSASSDATPTMVGDTSVRPCRISLPKGSAALPSSEIAKNTLRDVQEVLEENTKLRTESAAGTLCQKLAKEAIFGKELMRRCTPNGTRDFPALPREELYTLKTIMFNQFPRFQRCPGAFESVWKKCVVAIEQACKRLRA